MKNTNKHFSFSVCDEIKKLCVPLEESFGCNLFIYQKNLVNAANTKVEATAFLCNDQKILNFILELRKGKRESVKYDYDCFNRQYVFLETTQPKFATLLEKNFSSYHVLCRDEKLITGEWEHFIIGSKYKDKNIINKYINNIFGIDKFVIFFRELAFDLIEQACQNMFITNRPIEQCSFKGKCNMNFSKPKHFHLINFYNEIVLLTFAELKTLIYFSMGKTAKEIAILFNLSFRTVEAQIYSGKLKMKCKNNSQLFDVLKKNNIVDFTYNE